MKYDKRNITAMVTGMVIGAALVSEAAAGIVAEPTWQKIYVDGRQVSMTAYNIAGHNYVRLRDIGQQVDFNVYWSDGVQIDTGAPYTGIAPVQEISSQPTDMEIREEMIRRINEVRRKYSVSELAVDQSLMDAAQECSSYLYTKHNNRVECETVAASGYPHGFGSNLTVFTVTNLERISEKAVANWENSPGHLATMIDPNCNAVGVGVTIANGKAFCYMFAGNPTAHNPYA
ncbi:CAP domain-containing protein [Oscillibacter valericigenes]|uniref:CAP domain-containing protein n=1 Tax=Oscillibacter valericigenes TaxID=351091 RepID=UPI001F208EE0|nr:CAP domain-containing protein [Oscillibacter valericigenes]MCF2617895.1 CAP domain-containing protein [Oscillibacter valericigenes]